MKGDWTLRIEQAENVPITLGGRAGFMIANALAASLAAFAQGISIEHIRAALTTFRTSVEQTPGRMNLFDLGQFSVLVDYAHNPAGYEAIGEFVQKWPGQRIGVVGGPGDRRDQDLEQLGELSAKIFDWIIIKEDDDTRGRPRGDAAYWIERGVHHHSVQRQYDIIHDEVAAIQFALDRAPQGSLVVIFPAEVSRTIQLIHQHHQRLQGETTNGFHSEGILTSGDLNPSISH